MDDGAGGATIVRMVATSPIRELDRRISDGIEVRLCWSPQDEEVFVALTDRKTGDAFEVAVRRNESALDVFHHPYAFAAVPGRRRDCRQTAPADATPAGTTGKRGSGWLRAFVPARRARAL
jgi:hypothetical protein